MIKLNEFNSLMAAHGWKVISQRPDHLIMKYDNTYNSGGYILILFYRECYLFHYSQGAVADIKHYSLGELSRVNPEIIELRSFLKEV